MTKLYLLSKQIHRFCLILIVGSGGTMMLTGMALKYSSFVYKYMKFVDLQLFRTLHNTMSGFFSPVLFVMMLTGIVMYVYPVWVKKAGSKQVKVTKQIESQ